MSHQTSYLTGIKNNLSSEAVPGSLPLGQNSPQHPPFGLYAEQLSGSAFTSPRHKNLRSWLYRIYPSVKHSTFSPLAMPNLTIQHATTPPNQLRWSPMPIRETSFLDGLTPWIYNGDHHSKSGATVYLFTISRSMQEFFYNSDGEMLLIIQQGELLINTEMGNMTLTPGEIAVIPRGIKIQIKVTQPSCGYLLENYGEPLELPELGPLGANGLANPRDFLIPAASYTDQSGDFTLVTKFNGKLWQANLDHNPLNVVAWHGNYFPYKYDLHNFNTINTVSFDHPDPSIFTVLTSQTSIYGTANVDFVIFPSRWMVAEHSFRPPYYHRNTMSEFMGLIYGEYDAKPEGFHPGGSSLHNCMSAHGPDTESFINATSKETTPEKLTNTLAFMFESNKIWHPTKQALTSELLQPNYQACWQDLPKNSTLQQG